jgi:type II secretory pathway pseudopilin PulG
MVEIIIVLVVIGIMTAISLPYLLNYTKKYKTEDQAIRVMDLLREAGQRALTTRNTHRFEINGNLVRIVEEGGPYTKTVPLEQPSAVRMDVLPTGVNFTGIPFPAFPTGTSTVVYFKSNGSVVNSTVTNIPVSGTLIFWSPKDDPYNPSNLAPPRVQEIRAVSMSGASGAVRFFKYNGTTFQPWQ